MPVTRSLIGLSLLMLLCVGCGQEQPTGVAIVDLDEVAKRLGRDQTIVDSVKDTQEELNKQLNNILAQLRVEYQKQKEKFGDTPTEEEQAQLKGLESRMTALINQKGRQASSIFRNEQLKLLVRFREEIKPIAKEIAAEKGFAIVIPKDQNMLLASDPAIDITEQVIAKMKANPLPAAPAAQ
ncbi:MAG: OmpH family outer membrane protein, partial [Planctomycetaceae bacterium]